MALIGMTPVEHRRIRAPMAVVAISLAAGIAAGRFMPLTTGFWAVLAGAAFIGALVTFRAKHLHLLTCGAVVTLVTALGAVHARLAYFHIAEDHIATYTGRSDILATIRGSVATAPKSYSADRGVVFGYRPKPRTGMLVAVTAVDTRDGWRPAGGLVRVTVKEPVHSLQPGMDVELVGRLGRFRGPGNPGQFDWSAAARDRQTLARFTVEGADGVTIIDADGDEKSWPIRAVRHLRAAARQHLAMTGDQRDASLLKALLLGERDPALATLNRAMVRAGVAHFLSISGLHLAVFLGLVFLLCRLILSPRRAAMVVLVVLAIYMLTTEPRAPLLRSAAMATALCLAIILRRPQCSLNALAVAAVILLAVDPLQLFSAAFQLSFAIVAGLLLFCRNVEDLLFGRWRRRRGLMVFRDEDRLKRWAWYTLGNLFTGAVAMATTAYVVAAPLVAYHFGLFCPYAAVLSLLLFPLVVAVLVPGYVAIALAAAMPGLSHSIGTMAAGAANLLATAVEGLQVLPGMSFELFPMTPAAPALCYAAMLLIAARRRLRFARPAAAAVAAIAVAVIVWSQLPAAAPEDAELHLLSVGAGQCALLRTPGGKTVLIDAGTQSGFDAYEQTLGPFLRYNRFHAPTAAFVSHANSDHYNAMAPLMQRRHLQDVYVNEYFGRPVRGIETPQDERKILGILTRGADRVIRLEPGRTIRLDNRTTIEVLWPRGGRSDLNVNNTSLVLKITCDDRTVLLPGDLGIVGQGELAQMGSAVRADALVLPHHGAWRSTLPAFVSAVGPHTVLTSGPVTPARRAGGRPEALEFFATLDRSSRCYSTARNGWIRLTFGRGEMRVDSMRP